MLKELTILIPTYNRPQKLRRFLLYTVISYPGNELVFSKIRIKIADGSLSEDSSCNILIENLSRMGVAIEYSRLPGESLVRRLMLAVNSVDTKYVMTCGDDDLIDFQGLSTWLSEKIPNKENISYCGRFTNIIGLSFFGIFRSCAERPYYGFKIDSLEPIHRVLQYGIANSFGVASLAYTIQPSWLLKEFWNSVGDDEYYYGGLEFMHQIFSMSRAACWFAPVNLIYRDFSYISYVPEQGREAPRSNPYPYYGENAIKKSTSFISEYCGLNETDANYLINQILDFGAGMAESKGKVESSRLRDDLTICPVLSSKSKTNLNIAWRNTYLSCYPKKEGIKRFISLTLRCISSWKIVV